MFAYEVKKFSRPDFHREGAKNANKKERFRPADLADSILLLRKSSRSADCFSATPLGMAEWQAEPAAVGAVIFDLASKA
jgi:hypothetical protein